MLVPESLGGFLTRQSPYSTSLTTRTGPSLRNYTSTRTLVLWLAPEALEASRSSTCTRPLSGDYIRQSLQPLPRVGPTARLPCWCLQHPCTRGRDGSSYHHLSPVCSGRLPTPCPLLVHRCCHTLQNTPFAGPALLEPRDGHTPPLPSLAPIHIFSTYD